MTGLIREQPERLNLSCFEEYERLDYLVCRLFWLCHNLPRHSHLVTIKVKYLGLQRAGETRCIAQPRSLKKEE